MFNNTFFDMPVNPTQHATMNPKWIKNPIRRNITTNHEFVLLDFFENSAAKSFVLVSYRFLAPAESKSVGKVFFKTAYDFW